jgi:integrase/recombinase XerD
MKMKLSFPLKIGEETLQHSFDSVAKEVNARSQARIISGPKVFSYLILKIIEQSFRIN